MTFHVILLSLFFPEYEGKHFFRNSCKLLLQYVVSHPEVMCAHTHCHEKFQVCHSLFLNTVEATYYDHFWSRAF
jgi:hypothetical protein